MIEGIVIVILIGLGVYVLHRFVNEALDKWKK